MVDIYEWLFPDGSTLGHGTKAELAYWQQEGIIDPAVVLGDVFTSNKVTEDARRATCWGIGEFLDTVPA